MSASLSVPANVIQNAPATCVLTISNSSGSSVNVVSIQPLVVNGAAVPCVLTPPFIPPSLAQSSVGGSQQKIQVPGNGSVSVSFQVTPLGPSSATDELQQAAQNILVTAQVASSDGSVVTAVPQWLAPANRRDSTLRRALVFNDKRNSSLVL